ncbi:MAG: FecR domain-containing protein [Prolixibacteraceae bacterium]
MLKKNEIERIARYTEGMSDQGDTAWIEDLFSQGHSNQQLKHHLEKDWGNVLPESLVEPISLNGILDRVHHLIREKELQKRKTLVFRITDFYLKAAAILLLPLIVGGSLYFGYLRDSATITADRRGSYEVYAPLGSRIAFSLPDGTTGWLNSGSTLSYSLPFTEHREVALEGEAWFDVFHNEKQPFGISAGESTIKVLGTSFNVSAYLDEKNVEVVLLSGKVEFSDKTLANKVVLKPSEQLVLHEGQLRVSSVDASKYKAWTDGRLIFRGDNMAEVARRIERWYNVRVEIADKDLYGFSFRATFEDDSLEDVLRQLSMTSPIEYTIIQRKQLQNGTFEKAKVILDKAKRK